MTCTEATDNPLKATGVGGLTIWVQVPAPISTKNKRKVNTNTMDTAKEGLTTKKAQLARKEYQSNCRKKTSTVSSGRLRPVTCLPCLSYQD
jgi:hypothetical protein